MVPGTLTRIADVPGCCTVLFTATYQPLVAKPLPLGSGMFEVICRHVYLIFCNLLYIRLCSVYVRINRNNYLVIDYFSIFNLFVYMYC